MRRFALKPRRLLRRHAVAALAFAAMLLLLVMPTTGRLLGVLSAGSYGMPHAMAVAGHAAMAMPGHAAAITNAGAHESGHPALPDGNRQHPDNGTCPYCPLLTSMLALVLYVALLAATPAPQPARAARRLAYAATLLRGLGARGPPVSL